MNLRTQLLLISGCFFILQISLFYAFFEWGLSPKISQLEQELLEKNLTRGMEILQREFTHLEHTTQLLAATEWIRKDTAPNASFSPKAIDELSQTMAQQELNLLYILDDNNTALWGNIISLDTLSPYPSTTFLLSLWKEQPDFLKHSSTQSLQAGIHNSSLGPMLIVSVPILSTDPSLKMKGTLITGKLVAPEIIKMLQTLTFANIKIWPLEGATLSKKFQEISQQLSQTDSNFLVENIQDAFLGYVSLSDLNNKSNILISSTQPRDFSYYIKRYAIEIAFSFILLQLMMMALLSWSIRKRSIVPMRNLIQQISKEPKTNQIGTLPPQLWGEFTPLAQALSECFERIKNLLTHQDTLAYRHGQQMAYEKIYRDSETILKTLNQGFIWLENELLSLPTDELEGLLAESKVSHIQEQIYISKELPKKLEEICNKLRLYEKNMRAQTIELHNQVLRNAALLRLHSHSLSQHSPMLYKHF